MATRCNRGFYCRSYCLLNMFYTAVAACGISCCGFQVAGLVWSWGLCVRFAGCCSSVQVLAPRRTMIQIKYFSSSFLKFKFILQVKRIFSCWINISLLQHEIKVERGLMTPPKSNENLSEIAEFCLKTIYLIKSRYLRNTCKGNTISQC